MASNPRNDATRAPAKGPTGGGYSGAGKASFRHIDDIVSVNVDLDPHTPLRKVIQAGDGYMQQAITFKEFGRLDLALQEYIRAFTIAVDKVPKHKDYVSLRSDRGELGRAYHALKVKITNNGVVFDKIKEVIKEDNMKTGVRPENLVSKFSQSLLLDLPSVPSNSSLQESTDSRHARSETPVSNGQSIRPGSQTQNGNGAGRKTKPAIQPKPQALHGNSVKPSLEKPSPDLVARFAKLRDPLETRNTNSPPPLPRPTGPRAMPSSHRMPTSTQSVIPAMPKMPDAIYSPARGTVTSEAANLPSSTPRGMFSRTNSVVSVSGASSRTSMDSMFRTASAEQFVTAHTYGDAQSSPKRTSSIPEGDLISIKELRRCLDDKSLKVLLIDVRDRQLFDEGHIGSQNTICLDPTILSRQNISANEIVDSMILAPTTERLAFEGRDKVDLVVFYDQYSISIPQRISSNIEEAVLYNLRQALVEYSFPKSLSRTPKLLRGGLDTWADQWGPQTLRKSKTQSVQRHKTSTSISTRQRLRNRELKPEEIITFEDMIGREMSGDFDYAKSRDDFMRRFPSLREPESMISAEENTQSIRASDSGTEAFLKDMSVVPPSRPKPSVARTRYSGLESADEHPPSGGQAMKATVTSNAQRNNLTTGLINPGNWCYANASIQALLSCPGFVDEFLDPQWPAKYRPDEKPGSPAYNQLMCRILGNLFQWLGQRSLNTMKASTLMHYLRTIHAGYATPTGSLIKFGDTHQHDSDELITFLFGQLEVETGIKLSKNHVPPLDTTQAVGYVANSWSSRSYNVINKHWYVVELQTLTCDHCGAKNFIVAELERYSFHVPQYSNDGKLEALMATHFVPEHLDSKCDVCKKFGKSSTKQVARLPPLLRVCLSRTDQMSSVKFVNHCEFPFDNLRFGNYILEANERRQIAKILGGEAADGFDGPATYDLFAVICHAGPSLNSGHYICFTRNQDNTWTHLNDSTVTKEHNLSQVKETMYRCQQGFTPVQLYYKRNKPNDLVGPPKPDSSNPYPVKPKPFYP
ncbi:hypothetical protein F4808DRAFT_202436 [Astrocystis sublimbata]|nr:hypothetical protein F4808DRAFT_202436 [Astrocystis sublimbata]